MSNTPIVFEQYQAGVSLTGVTDAIINALTHHAFGVGELVGGGTDGVHEEGLLWWR
jgi:hypothetical protein